MVENRINKIVDEKNMLPAVPTIIMIRIRGSVFFFSNIHFFVCSVTVINSALNKGMNHFLCIVLIYKGSYFSYISKVAKGCLHQYFGTGSSDMNL